MKSWLGATLVALLLASPAWPAGPWGNRPGHAPQDPRARPDDRGASNRGVPPPPQDQRAERSPQRSQGALTDEERRGLRRDLDKANRELYRRR